MEKAFSIPGIGSYFFRLSRTTITMSSPGISFIYSVMFVMAACDILYGVIDRASALRRRNDKVEENAPSQRRISAL